MIIKGTFFLIFFSITLVTYAGSTTDTLYLKNGELLIGELKSAKLGILTFDSDAFGIINIKMYKIKTIKASRNTMRIETINKEVLYGKLDSCNEDGKAYVIFVNQKTKIDLNDINSLLTFKKGILNRVDGNVSAGFSYTRSSSIGQFNLSSTVNYKTKKIEANLNASAIGSLDSSNFSRDRENLTLSCYYYFKPSWFVATAVNYQRNLQLSIARRFQELAGIGNKFLLSQHVQALAISGITFSQEKSVSGSNSNTLIEFPFIIKFDYFKFKHPNLQISTYPAFYFSLSQWGRVRFDGNTGFYWELIKDFSLSLTFYTSYDNKPPGGSGKSTDYGTVIGLTYKF